MLAIRRTLPYVFLSTVGLLAPSAHAQTIDDAVMMPKKELCTGLVYGHDTWDEYWEGTLKRDNGNVGTLTTNSVSWMGTYGLTDRVNLIAMLPRISTHSSGGTLEPQSGLQDLTVAAKVRVLDAGAGSNHALRGFAVASYGTPVSDYVIDLLPLSIGSHSKRLSGRLTGSYERASGLFGDATAAYTWRDNVTLDRPSYFTDGQLFLTDQVEMPNVFDYAVRVGYQGHRFMIPLTYFQQNTLGGGDIRRQDMPFVSNKMNLSRLGLMAKYTLPNPARLALQVELDRVLAGRNVGQSTTLSAGFTYAFAFHPTAPVAVQ